MKCDFCEENNILFIDVDEYILCIDHISEFLKSFNDDTLWLSELELIT